MGESILLAILYGIILNVPAAVCGVVVNLIVFPRNKPSAAIVAISCLVFLFVAFPLVMDLFGNKIGMYGAAIATIISLFSFSRTVDI
ncbi:TPA: hypothetical protein ACIR1F_004718 [Enterobacter roggenkampii]